MTDPRPTPPERVPVEVKAWREARQTIPDRLTLIKGGDDLAAALEATAGERDRLAKERDYWKRAFNDLRAENFGEL